MPTDRALRPSCSRYIPIRARGAGPPEAIGLRCKVKLGAAPEIDRHTLQLSEPPRPAMATSLRVTNPHGHKPPCSCSCYAL